MTDPPRQALVVAAVWLAGLPGCNVPAVIAREPHDGDRATDAAAWLADARDVVLGERSRDAAAAPDVPLAVDAPTGSDGDDTTGGGTHTLVIAGEIEVANVQSNALTADDFRARFEINVSRRGAGVPDATVVLTSAGGALRLVPENAGSAHYVGSQPGYFTAYTLDVTAGADTISGARLVGPAPHAFIEPRTSERHRSGAALTIQWAPSGTTNAVLTAGTLDPTRVPDTGTYLVGGSALEGVPGALRDDVVRLVRVGAPSVPGAAAGSFVDITVLNSVTYVLDGT